MLKHKRLLILIVMILTLGILAACGDSGETNEEGNNNQETSNANEGASEEENSSLSGTVKLAGSSTVFPIMEYVTYEFTKKYPNVDTPLESIGSGGGFERSTKGEIDFSNASRPIKKEEKAIAEENGIELIETVLAYDGLSVVVSQKNDFVDKLTVEQLRDIFLAERGNKKWSDINPSWPDEEIVIYSPGHASGTFDYFNEAILEEKPMREGEGVTLSEDDNLLVRGIQNDPYAIGYFGYAYYVENKDTLKALGIDNGNGAVKPSPETIQDGSYSPLSRPLFTYINRKSLEEKETVQAFTEFLLSGAAASGAKEVGYVALPEEKYQSQLKELKSIYE
ncbi:PstS family phosphate ABC transporter substrate-binding protein [Virgibacillus sp. MSP4-1]|uniref:PstS family phosphate ABC transporter substrate-binding protein n=1 Tax=Virgibacillus sp. MSP4-1 TaxID=2700081 RepID=UPI00039E445E|nr:PstS family phosphate ABC transporter substrate-binding protein [Virgibacillus sp. MSP4-1]QHS22769.1 PstS family phosphate ABC transporter substrate-binding protein [Virgibacillus sp. MSP4-1]